jgi:hypothetical protein
MNVVEAVTRFLTFRAFGYAPRGALWSAVGLLPRLVARNGANPCRATESGGKPSHSKALRRGDDYARNASTGCSLAALIEG